MNTQSSASGSTSKHALLSPSASERWLSCHVAPLREQKYPRTSSVYADWGVACHAVAESCLGKGFKPKDFITVTVEGMTFDEEMAECTAAYVDYINAIPNVVEREIEVKLDISQITGEDGATGTADAILIAQLVDGSHELIVADLKTGKGVEVSAENNSQLMIYAAAAYSKFDLFYDISSIRLLIVQPRINNYSEWVCSPVQLWDFAREVEGIGATILNNNDVLTATPSEDACRWCKAKADCPELAAEVNALLTAWPKPDMADDERLATLYSQVKLVAGWCEAVAQETERRLASGRPVPGYKLVEGRKSARAWDDAEAVEAEMKASRIKHEWMYDYKLKSPTQAEKVLKEEKPRVWTKLAARITQKPGKPTVAPIDDPRQAIQINTPEQDFAALDISDLL